MTLYENTLWLHSLEYRICVVAVAIWIIGSRIYTIHTGWHFTTSWLYVASFFLAVSSIARLYSLFTSIDTLTLTLLFHVFFPLAVITFLLYDKYVGEIDIYMRDNRGWLTEWYLHCRITLLTVVFLILAYQLSELSFDPSTFIPLPDWLTIFIPALFTPLMCDSTWAPIDPVTGQRIVYTGSPIPWTHTSQLTSGHTVLNNMYAWACKKDTTLAQYLDSNCAHLLAPLGTHSNPIMTDVLSTIVPQGHSFLNSKPTTLLGVHNNKGGVYLFYDPTVLDTNSPECTKYVGVANLFANRLRTHMQNYKHFELPAGKMKLYQIMRNNPHIDLHWQPLYSITPYTSDYLAKVGNISNTSESILHAFTSYQLRAIEQSLISYCLPNANTQHLVTLDYLAWYPGLESNTKGREVWIYLNNGSPIDPAVDLPYRIVGSVYKALETTGLSSILLLKGYMNTMLPVYSKTLGRDVSFWRWDQDNRIGEKRGVQRTFVPDLPINPLTLPVGEIHTYTNVDGKYVPFMVYGSYGEAHTDLGADYTFKGFLSRISLYVNTAHGTHCTSIIAGASYMLYFARNPSIRTSSARAKAGGLITVTDTKTGAVTTHEKLSEMRSEYGLDKEMRMTMYIKHGYLIHKRYRITRTKASLQ